MTLLPWLPIKKFVYFHGWPVRSIILKTFYAYFSRLHPARGHEMFRIKTWKDTITENVNYFINIDISLSILLNTWTCRLSIQSSDSPLLENRFKHDNEHVNTSWHVRTNSLKNLFQSIIPTLIQSIKLDYLILACIWPQSSVYGSRSWDTVLPKKNCLLDYYLTLGLWITFNIGRVTKKIDFWKEKKKCNKGKIISTWK